MKGMQRFKNYNKLAILSFILVYGYTLFFLISSSLINSFYEKLYNSTDYFFNPIYISTKNVLTEILFFTWITGYILALFSFLRRFNFQKKGKLFAWLVILLPLFLLIFFIYSILSFQEVGNRSLIPFLNLY